MSSPVDFDALDPTRLETPELIDVDDGWDSEADLDYSDEEYASVPGGALHIANILGQTYEAQVSRLLCEHTGSPRRFLTVEQEHALAAQIQDGIAAQSEKEALEARIESKPRLSRSLQDAYFGVIRRIRAGREAEHLLVECNLRIATYLARLSMNIVPGSNDEATNVRLRAGGRTRTGKRHIFKETSHAWVPSDPTRSRTPYAVYDDRVQMLNVGIIKAARSFTPGALNKKGEPAKFISFCMPALRASLIRFVGSVDERPGPSLSATMRAKIAAVRRLDTPPQGMSMERFLQFKEWDTYPETVPLDELVLKHGADEERDKYDEDPSRLPMAEVMADTNSSPLATEFFVEQRRAAIDEALGNLSERLSGIIRLTYGLDDRMPRTLDEVGQVYGISRERARQLLIEALSKLRSSYRSLLPYVGLDGEHLDIPTHASTYPRFRAEKHVGGGAIHYAQDLPGEGPTGADITALDRETWQAYPSEEWETSVRLTPEQLARREDEIVTELSKLITAAPLRFFQYSPGGDAVPRVPTLPLEQINAALGDLLLPHHIQRVWNEELESILHHFGIELGDDFNPDRVVLLISKMLAERMTDDDTIEFNIPERLDGRLNYIGAWLENGKLIINGNAGASVGFGMHGLAQITVEGSAGDFAGTEVRGMSHLEIMGNAGWFVGSKASGMASIQIYGSVLDYCGHRVKSPDVHIEVLEDAGEHFGYEATDGHFLVCGTTGSVELDRRFKGSIDPGVVRNKP